MMVTLVYHTSGPLRLLSLHILMTMNGYFQNCWSWCYNLCISLCLKIEWWQRGAGLSCRPDLLLLLVFGMLGFPDSITTVITAIIYEAGKRISDSGDQQLARSEHTACLLLRPFILHTFIYSVSPDSSLVLVLTSTFSLAKSCSNLWIFWLFEGCCFFVWE